MKNGWGISGIFGFEVVDRLYAIPDGLVNAVLNLSIVRLMYNNK